MRHNYGYKVCYREHATKFYVRYFMTYTYKQAAYARRSYVLYPPRTREDNRKLILPIWRIIPISRDEVSAGIWREVPF